MARLSYLQIFKHDDLITKAEFQLRRVIRVYPLRGTISDRYGRPLAISRRSYSVYAVPKKIKNKLVWSQKVALILNSDWHEIKEKMMVAAPFVWVKRQISDTAYEKLRGMEIEGLGFIKEQIRGYPEQNLAAHVLGFVGIDNQGLGGIEYEFDHLLTGKPGKILVEGDPGGQRIMSGVQKMIKPSFNGGNVVLTLDEFAQYAAQKHLKNGIEKFQAESGQAIIMNPANGEILAMASFPDFNPNHWSKTSISWLKNPSVADLYEPGSIFKIITIGIALDLGLVHPETRISVPESITVNGRLIREAHKRTMGEGDDRSVSEILEKSLNVGSALIAEKIGKEKFYDSVQKWGFGRRTGITLPGEESGLLLPLRRWAPVTLATVSFGQGVGTTGIQMASTIGTVANHGERLEPHIVKTVSSVNGKTLRGFPRQSLGQIIRKETAQKIKEMLIRVVETGTGQPAKIPGYTIAGKTGTAQKVAPLGMGYLGGKYIASFVGFFPAHHPSLLILVIVDSPKTSIYGATVAGPIFKNIALDLINYMNIPPDSINSAEKFSDS